tara:strand:- start:401 stop:1303 length:903 start_codon:yes stop_codon:yes gene_type:complete
MEKNRLVHLGIIGIFLSLYFLVATISMINSVAFFDLAHEGYMNWALAIGFELGAAASLAAIIILDKTNRTMVWGLFILLTSFQMMANSFHAFINLENYMGWIELFGLEEAEPIYQKRVLSVVSGAILPLVALGFIKSLVDYIRPEEPESIPQPTAYVSDEIPEIEEDIPEEAKKWKGAFDIETPVAGSAEPRIHPQDPYDIDNDDFKEIIPEASEEALEEDLYSRDAEKAKLPAEIGEVHIAPETVKTENVVADDVEKPINTEHITPVGDPIVIPTPETTASKIKPKLTSRKFAKRSTNQ